MKDKPVILVVDDRIQNIELLEAYLVPQGYEVITAEDGEEALGKLSGNQIDLILLDVMMSGMDGFEVTRRVRQDNEHRMLPIILITTLRESEDRIKGIEAGCDDFISKPFDKMALLARVRSLLKVKTYHDMMSDYRKKLEVSKISADEAHEYAESIINTVREPLIVLDHDLRVVKASRSFYDVFRVKREETMGKLIYDLGNKQWDIPNLRDLLETILPQKTTFDNYEVEHDFATIGRRMMLLNARQIQRGPEKERIILLAIEDITERKLAEEKIRQMAFHDSLTGLPNRKLFSDRLDIALAHAKRDKKTVGIVMIDLDNFKDVNDTYGHDAGDILLKAVAERLSGALRKSDTVARFGGDEFILIFPALEAKEDAILAVQKIVDWFHKPFHIGAHQLVITMSIGIAVYPNNGTDEGSLLKNADIAMYQAKQAGRARYRLCKQI
ncbi:MAG: diguanylate cyclase [Desulfobacteraceae bacterium]|jgi:diguanylate cyclase (GGDEF)-like protein/PAS domain S-box-containing protein